MKIKVVYHSFTGNTEKLACAIADMLNIQAEHIGKDNISFSDNVDLLFIGDGIYWNGAHKKTRNYISQLSPETVKNAAVFGTYGNQFKIGDILKNLLIEKGINVVGTPFTCKGKSLGTKNQGHPDENDIKMVCEYTRSIIAQIG
jgi:flavodoxin